MYLPALKPYKWLLLFLTCVSTAGINSPVAATEFNLHDTHPAAAIRVNTSTPPVGFENLAEPQTTMVDVYFQNRPVTTALITHTIDQVEIDDPDKIIAALTDFGLRNPDTILQNLSSPLDSNASLVCSQYSGEDCGVLFPKIVGVIFNESYFRLDVFINAAYIEQSAVYDDRYLPESSLPLSLVNSIDINTSGGEQQTDVYNIHSSSLLAYQQSRLSSELNYTDEEQFQVDELSFQQDHKTWELEAGIFDTRGRFANFITQKDILGLRIASSLKTRVDLDVAQGTPIYIFLNQRSRVEIYKDNRLIDARFYEAGNQQLDSSHFPEGSYNIDVRIRDQSGREREESFFFIKTTLLPPDEELSYFVEFGRIQEVAQQDVFADLTDAHLFRIGTDLRIHDRAGVELELDHTNNQSMLQGGFIWFLTNWRTQLNSMYTSENDWGISFRNNINFSNLSANLDFRYVHEGEDSDASAGDFDFVEQSSLQSTASITHVLFGGRASWLYRHIDSDQQPKSESYGVTYRKQVYSFNNLQADLTVNVNKNSDDYLLQTGIRFLWRDKNTQYRLNPTHEYSKTNNTSRDQVIGSASGSFVKEHENIGRLRTTVFHNEEINSSTQGVNFQSESQIGFHDLEFNRTHQDRQNTLAYVTNHRLNLATDFDHLALGGRRADLSALIIDIEGAQADAAFNVYVDRQFAGKAYIGKSSVFGLPPYHEYEIRLESIGEDFVEFDESVKYITLYPGNVAALNYEISREVVIVGQVNNSDGTPLQNARIENLQGFAGTDENGWFQIESSPIKVLQFKQTRQPICTVTLPNLNAADKLFVFESLQCLTK